MKNKITVLGNLLMLLVTFVFLTSFNKSDNQESPLCKAWKIDYTLIDGKKELPRVDEKDDKTTFYSNSTFKSFESKDTMTGNWKLDAKNNTITITFKEIPESLVLKIIKINDKELVLESNNENIVKRVFLIPAL